MSQAEVLHQGDVLRHPVVVVARDVAVVGVHDGAGHAAEGVPDRRGPAVLERGALDLERRGRGAEQEVRREGSGAGGGAGHDEGVLSKFDGHPFTAPAMMPLTSCLPAKTKSRISGMVDSSTPASTIE